MEKQRISIMAAITDERGLGKDNDLLVKIPDDFIRMKRLTVGHPIVMGRRTFESIGRPLPGRLNVVITHNATRTEQSVTFTTSLEEALQIAKEYEQARIAAQQSPMPDTKYQIQNTDPEIFIFGGGQIFKEALPQVDRLYLTVIHKNFPADVFFPDYNEFTKVIEKEDRVFEDIHYTFLTLER